MKLSVIIVNYNVKYYLEQCLCSLYRALTNVQAEVFVVDNASSDDSQSYITGRFPRLTYLYNEENVGFARANNQAICQARGEFLLLLNPDTVLPESTLTEVLSFMDEHPRAGAAGVKMITADGSFLPESKRGYPSPMTSLWKLTGIHRLFPRSARFDGYYLSHLNEDAIHRIDVLAGAFMLLRRTALDACGLLDEDFFMYGEDIDLSCRIVQAGFENYYLPFPILHYKGVSTVKESYRYVTVFYGAMGTFFRKHNEDYSLFTRQLVQAGIRLQTGLMLAKVWLRQQRRHLLPEPGGCEPRLLVFASEKSVHGIRALCRRNKLNGRHHFVIANELSAALGHASSFVLSGTFTHVVYDSDAFSFACILSLLSQYQRKGLQLGIYNAESHVLITPDKNYL